MNHEILQVYIWISSTITVICLLTHPTKLNRVDNVGGSIVAGVALGWLIWPFALWAKIKIDSEIARSKIKVNPNPDREASDVRKCELPTWSYPDNGKNAILDKQSEANARLIAAAPDLLEACKLSLKIMTDDGLNETVLTDSIRSAIAKAEGQ